MISQMRMDWNTIPVGGKREQRLRGEEVEGEGELYLENLSLQVGKIIQ